MWRSSQTWVPGRRQIILLTGLTPTRVITWATQQQQGGENKRSNIAVTVNGFEFKTLKAACIHFGVNYTTAVERMRSGVSLVDAVTVTGYMKPRRSRESYLPKTKR